MDGKNLLGWFIWAYEVSKNKRVGMARGGEGVTLHALRLIGSSSHDSLATRRSSATDGYDLYPVSGPISSLTPIRLLAVPSTIEWRRPLHLFLLRLSHPPSSQPHHLRPEPTNRLSLPPNARCPRSPRLLPTLPALSRREVLVARVLHRTRVGDDGN